MTNVELMKNLRTWVSSSTKHTSVPIKGLWHIDCVYKPTAEERKFVYQILVAQTVSQGACYYVGTRIPTEQLISLVGGTYTFSPHSSIAVDIALLDSVANSIAYNSYLEFYLSGQSSKKAYERSRIIASEVNRLACALSKKRYLKVCNVGVVSLLIQKLLNENFEVTATDMDETIIGCKLFDKIIVEPATQTLKNVSECDIAVVTGMTLATETLSSIIETAAKSGTQIVMFMETGSGFSSFLIDIGVACVVSEPFPFYIYNGLTHIRVFRASHL
jgi:hypothetical protein